MLFDLRGKGRRRTVRVIYIGLAMLMGIGLVGFGIGGGFGGGGLLNAASNNEGSNQASFSSQIKKYTKVTAQQPNNVAAWEKLTKALLHEAGGEAYITSTGYTTKGKELISQAGRAWESYLALNPPKPNTELAQLVANDVYVEGGLNQPAKALQALQVVIVAKPESAALWAQIAQYAYKAKNMRVGDLAAAKAVQFAPAAQKVRVKAELAEIRKNPNGEKAYTTTTNGKTLEVKKGANGQFSATEVKKTTSTAPTTTSTTTTTKK